MGMGIGINEQKPDAGQVRGRQEAVACGVWFTSTGRVLPRMLKFKDSQGEYRVLNDIHVVSFEEKYYCGIQTVEYLCEIMEGKLQRFFLLLFYVEKKEWKILWK